MIRRTTILLIGLLYWAWNRLAGLRSGSSGRWVLNVLCYHGVPPHRRDAFAWQVNYLSRRFVLVHPEAIGRLNAGDKAVLITFDDALLSLREHVLPLLKQRRMPCLIFVPTGYLGSRCIWMRTAEEWRAATGKDMALRDREQLETDRVMTREELKALDPSLCVLGSHTVNHCRLGKLPAAAAERELKDSSQALLHITGLLPRAISFPHGDYNGAVLAAAAAAGYDAAFSISPNMARGQQPVYGRVVVEPSDWKLEFIVKAHGGYEWIAHATRIQQRLRWFLGSRRPVCDGL